MKRSSVRLGILIAVGLVATDWSTEAEDQQPAASTAIELSQPAVDDNPSSLPPADSTSSQAEPSSSPAEKASEGSGERELGQLTRDQLEVQFERAAGLAKSGATDEAKKLFQALIVINPNLVEAYLNLAVLLSADGEFEHSADALESALSAHPICRAITELQFTDHLFHSSVSCSETEVSSPDPPQNAEIIEILEALEAWRKAWQDQRVDDYLSSYSTSFTPPGGVTRAEWETSRRARLAEAQSISLEVSIRHIEIESTDSAKVRFLQDYASTTFRDSVEKELRFRRSNGTWSIVSELTTPRSQESVAESPPQP